jgi:hypothetical protein
VKSQANDIRLGIVRGISYGLFGKPDVFAPQARALGARLLRVYFFWGQIEPRPGAYEWTTVDSLLDQLEPDDEVWITVCSSSRWATRESTDFLPPSPAREPATYAEFVRRLVRRCAGRVRYWQCDNEPSNIGLLWAGTTAEYVAQLTAFHAAVHESDAGALVVLGGCGYDVLSSGPDSPQREFFRHLVDAGRDAFDVFDVHLYGDPYRVPEYVKTARVLMRAGGYEKPVVAGEYAGPSLFEFPEAERAMQKALASIFAAPPGTQSTDALKEQARQETPERRAMRALYARMTDLPPRLQMFMAGCAPELEAKRHRIACRQLMMRNLLAAAAGVRRTLYWNLAPEAPGPADPYVVMHLLIGKLPLLDYGGGRIERRYPEADAFVRVGRVLAGAVRVDRIELPDCPTIYAFRVDCVDSAPVLVVWERRDAFDGECAAPVTVEVPWPTSGAHVADVFGNTHIATVDDGAVRLRVTDTPLIVSNGIADGFDK